MILTTVHEVTSIKSEEHPIEALDPAFAAVNYFSFLDQLLSLQNLTVLFLVPIIFIFQLSISFCNQEKQNGKIFK